MRGGFLGGLLNLQNGVHVAVSDAMGTVRDVQANHVVAHNLMNEKYGARAAIQNGIGFAKWADRPDQMNEAFDRFEKLQQRQADKGLSHFSKSDVDEQRR